LALGIVVDKTEPKRAELNNLVVCNGRRRACPGGRRPSLGMGTSLVC
jgi:hypothetical protein